MASGTALLSISEMIDLAIGSPEIGVVDFCMLHTVLHCLAQQGRCLEKTVELRGSVANIPTRPPEEGAPHLEVSEYVVDKSGSDQGRAELAPAPPAPKHDTMLVVERFKSSPESTSPTRTAQPQPQSQPQSQAQTQPATPQPASTQQKKSEPPKAGAEKRREPPTPRSTASTEKLSLVTTSKFNMLENVVQDLKDRVYGSMPKNEQILEEVRSQTNLKSITDMWTSLNVSSRLEAAEEGMQKLSSLVQDLIKEMTPPSREPSKHILPELSETQKAEPATKGEVTKLMKDLQDLSGEVRKVKLEVKQSMQARSTPALPRPAPVSGSPGGAPAAGTPGGAPAAGTPVAKSPGGAPAAGSPAPKSTAGGTPVAETPVAQPVKGETEVVQDYDAIEAPGDTDNWQGSTWTIQEVNNMLERLNALEKKLHICCDSIKKTDGIVYDQLSSFQDQLDHLTKELNALNDASRGALNPNTAKDIEGLMKLYETVQGMQNQLTQVHETAVQLAAEKDGRQQYLQTINDQIELLKTIKLDREDMEEALAEKADLRMVARKVSHDQFEMACDDLAKGLDHAVGKLNTQESLWQQALDDVQREIETKLDKMELSPVKEFFFNKLKQLQENLKKIAAMRRDAEAAGTKKKLLTDVNCISCDAKAVMKMETPASIPVMKPLPTTMSMKPYLSYELDAIRKSQASGMQQRNMHDWEAIEKQKPQTPRPVQKARSDTDRHLCNRYCGGSHTVTTPAQRVARTGHFIKQWGPEVLPLSSTLATGDDGRQYRVTAEVANVGTSAVEDKGKGEKPTAPPTEVSSSKPPKPVIIIEDCHCLDDPNYKAGSQKPRNQGNQSSRA